METKENMRIALASAVFLAVNSQFLLSQPAVQHPYTFEVASIKAASDPGPVPFFCLAKCTPGERMSFDGARTEFRYTSLYTLIVTAYRIKGYQLSGPEWMESQKFDISAKVPDGVSGGRVPEMLQALLAERFNLSIHRESKDLPVYALVVGKGGLKPKESTPEPDGPIPASPSAIALYTPQGDAHMEKDGLPQITDGPFGPMRMAIGRDGTVQMELSRVTMQGLADLLCSNADRPVVDMTELKGNYQMQIDFGIAPPSSGGGGRIPFDLAGALNRSIEKAGLKLERSKAPVETIVVDHMEKTPTDN
jgi:uncharacterized protein (TIGR03435 family)